jgi:DNA-binding CsgD family transcriptional regulator
MSNNCSIQGNAAECVGVISTKPPKNGKSPESKQPASGKNGPGLLLLDATWTPIWFNAEAVAILAYPQPSTSIKKLDAFLAERVRAGLFNPRANGEPPFQAEFRSGRRRYSCRTCLLASPAKGASLTTTALVLERQTTGPKALSEALGQYNFTTREQEAVECLLQGLTSKEIANRMQISPNTVKAYLRLIMIKMGVSTRSGVVGKIGMTRLTA